MQAEFKKGKATTDNIYIINYVEKREIKRKKGKMYAFFVDLTAAFDKQIEISRNAGKNRNK